jgi:hypothetical protein
MQTLLEKQLTFFFSEFTEEAWKGLVEGKEDVPVGMSKGPYGGWEGERRKQFEGRVEQMRKAGK